MTPTPDAQKIRKALSEFDVALRGTPGWVNWEAKGNHRFAIEVDGRRYPVKQVLSMASGQPVDTFSGGVQGANKVLVDQGFQVVALREAIVEDQQPMTRFRDAILRILSDYRKAATESKYSGAHPIVLAFEEASRALATVPNVVPRRIKVVASAGKGNWASVPWISMLDPMETDTTQKGVYIVYLFRGDMSGLYVTLNQGVTEFRELNPQAQTQELTRRADTIRGQVPELAAAGFALDNTIQLRSATSLGAKYERSTIAHKFYATEDLPGAEELAEDLHSLLDAYARYLDGKAAPVAHRTPTNVPSRSDTFAQLQQYIAATGFVFEPWQLATYVTALRTKPFVILAGVSGTGKSMLPQLVAAATGAQFQRVSVRPDWTDSSDILGYVDLRGSFRPGGVLQFARAASQMPAQQHVCLLDEMNLARVEQYFAELLSGMEDRHPAATGGFASPPLLVQQLSPGDAPWTQVGWPANLGLVGTVNMDESTHGFSRKVLDRAFTLEVSDIDLGNWGGTPVAVPDPIAWPMDSWHPRALRLSELRDLSVEESALIAKVVATLTEANTILTGVQAQVGYRVRDEVSLFVLHSRDLQEWFRTQPGEGVDPLDLALHMKVLPRLAGGTGAMRRVLLRLLGWAVDGKTSLIDEDLAAHATRWEKDGRGPFLVDARHPRTAARLCLMWERLQQEGFTSYWL
jgi:MrcB-like, N-terminal domain/AAA domain (dynein-related subfamily)